MKRQMLAGITALAVAVSLSACSPHDEAGEKTWLPHTSEAPGVLSDSPKGDPKDNQNEDAKKELPQNEDAKKPVAKLTRTVNGLTIPVTLAAAGEAGPNGIRYTDPNQPGLLEPDETALGSGRKALNTGFSMNVPGKPAAPLCANLAGTHPPKIQMPMVYAPNCANTEENVSGLKWLVWDNDVAFGVGFREINDCVPNCASGSKRLIPTTLTLLNPQNGVYTQGIADHGASGWDKYTRLG